MPEEKFVIIMSAIMRIKCNQIIIVIYIINIINYYYYYYLLVWWWLKQAK